MPRYEAKIEALAYGCKFVAKLEFYLAEGSTSDELARVADKYARARGLATLDVGFRRKRNGCSIDGVASDTFLNGDGAHD